MGVKYGTIMLKYAAPARWQGVFFSQKQQNTSDTGIQINDFFSWEKSHANCYSIHLSRETIMISVLGSSFAATSRMYLFNNAASCFLNRIPFFSTDEASNQVFLKLENSGAFLLHMEFS